MFELDGTVTAGEFSDRKNEIASRVAVNWVIAGVVPPSQLGVKQTLMELDMTELQALPAKSHLMKEEFGLPLIYRLSGI